MVKAKAYWGNLSIAKKFSVIILVAVFLLAIIPILVYYVFSASILRSEADQNIINTLNQTVYNLESNITTVNGMLYDLSTDSDLQNVLTGLDKGNLESDYEYWECYDAIQSISIQKKLKYEDIYSIYIYDLEGHEFAVGNYLYIREKIPDAEVFSEIMEAKGRNVWLEPVDYLHKYTSNVVFSSVPVGKAIYNRSTQQLIGYAIVYVNTEFFCEVISDLCFYKDDIVLLLDANENLLNPIDFVLSSISGRLENYNEIAEIDFNGEKKNIAVWPVDDGLMRLVVITENANKSHNFVVLRTFTFIMAIIVALVSLMIIRTVAKDVSDPILELAEDMQRFSAGDFSLQISAKYTDEVGILRRSFNKQVNDIRNLIDNVYREKNLKQQAKLKMLQMQINPHFLFNTLNTINWLAISHGDEDVSAMTQSLAYLMRFSLSDNELVPLEEELDAVEHYFLIQKYRYGSSLVFTYDICEEALYEIVPPHIIMPILENSLLHGLKNTIGEKKIHIACKIQDGFLEIRISDNGCGISREKLDMIERGLFSEESETTMEKKTIGLANVNQRLVIRYGTVSSLHISSEENKGTSVYFRIPCIKDTNADCQERDEIDELD